MIKYIYQTGQCWTVVVARNYRKVRMIKERIRVSLDPKVLEAIDNARGTIERSLYLNDLLYYGLVASEEEISRVKEMM